MVEEKLRRCLGLFEQEFYTTNIRKYTSDSSPKKTENIFHGNLAFEKDISRTVKYRV